MKAEDCIVAKGKVRFELTKPDGSKVIEEHDNLIVTVGKNHIASRLGSTATAMGWIAVGSGTNAPAAGDTALQTEITRKACSVNVSTNTVQFSVTLNPGEGTGAISEAGILNAASVGTLLSRVTFAVKNKEAADSLGITWTITIS